MGVMPAAFGNTDPADDSRITRWFKTWRRMISELARSDVELTPEEVAPMLVLHNHMRAAGVKFDPMLNVLLDKLRGQMFGTENDSDHDRDPGNDEEYDDSELDATDIETN